MQRTFHFELNLTILLEEYCDYSYTFSAVGVVVGRATLLAINKAVLRLKLF